jgi:hypothetical protein
MHGNEGGSTFDVPELGRLCFDKIMRGMFSDMHLIADELRR